MSTGDQFSVVRETLSAKQEVRNSHDSDLELIFRFRGVGAGPGSLNNNCGFGARTLGMDYNSSNG
jgi:hypothetical protein